VSAIEERGYRTMVEAQNDQQIDTWAADLFIDFAKRMGVGTAIAAFCAVTDLDAKGFQRAFLVGGGPDHVVGIDTAGALAAPLLILPSRTAWAAPALSVREFGARGDGRTMDTRAIQAAIAATRAQRRRPGDRT